MKLTFSLPTTGVFSGGRSFAVAALSAVALFLAGPGTPTSAKAQGAGELTVSPTTINFGRVTLGHLTPSETVTLTNGGGPVHIRSITLQGINRGEYGIYTNTCGGTLAANESCELGVAFSPDEAAEVLAAIYIEYGAAGSPPQIVQLEGHGIH
jgi:hypothetical protein